jgi:hypothetical protein
MDEAALEDKKVHVPKKEEVATATMLPEKDDEAMMEEEEEARMEEDKKVYVPKKVQAVAAILMADQNVDACLLALRQMYPNLCSFRSALSRIKYCILATNTHHPDYDAAMRTWQTTVENAASQDNATLETLKRLQEFQNFQKCSLKRQLHLQKKIALGQGADFFSHPDDASYVTTLKLAPDYASKLHLNAGETRTLQEKQAANIKCLSSTVVRIENADELVADARRILKKATTENACAIAVAIALTTGRRMIEVLQRGSFTEQPRQKYTLLFTGQAKAGLQEVVSITKNEAIEYTIPVLAPANVLVKAMAVLRKMTNTATMDSKHINSMWCRKLNEHVKSHVHPDLGFHDLRTLYALIAFEALKPHTYSVNAFVAKTLGHTGLGMSVAYTRMQVYGINKLRRYNSEAAEDF